LLSVWRFLATAYHFAALCKFVVNLIKIIRMGAFVNGAANETQTLEHLTNT